MDVRYIIVFMNLPSWIFYFFNTIINTNFSIMNLFQVSLGKILKVPATNTTEMAFKHIYLTNVSEITTVTAKCQCTK